MDFDLVFERFIDHSRFMRNLSNATITGYRENIGFFKRTQAVHTIEAVTEKTVRSFFMFGRMERKWQPNTFLNYYKTLSVFVRWCFSEGYLQGDNFMEDIETPKLDRSLPKRIATEDAILIMEVAQNYPYSHAFLRYRNHAIFAMFVYAGLRKSELLNLKCVDVDIEKRSIFVRLGKGKKDRIIPMSHTLAHILVRYIDARKQLHKESPQFFVHFREDIGLTKTGLRNMQRRIVKASKVSFTIHQLRHTFATLMLEGGCDIYSLSKMMGHSDIGTTTIYLSASAEHLRKEMYKHPLN